MLSFHAVANIYLIAIFLGVLVVLVKLYDLKLLLKTFFESAALLGRYIDKLESELRREEIVIGHRVDKLCDDVLDILRKLEDTEKK